MDEAKDTRDAAGPVNYVTMRRKCQKKPATECKFCLYEHAPKHYPTYSKAKECRKCGKINLFGSKCKQQKYVKQVQAAVCDNEYSAVLERYLYSVWGISAVLIVFACEKFDQYMYGREKVHVQIDHKPLEVIFRKALVTAPSRLQRTLLRLQRYADTSSRAYIPGEPSVHVVALA